MKIYKEIYKNCTKLYTETQKAVNGFSTKNRRNTHGSVGM